MKYLTLLLLFSSLFLNAQTQKGDLLLESTINGSWTSIELSDNATFGYYVGEKVAITLGFNIGIIDNVDFHLSLGSRYHINEHVLTFLDFIISDLEENRINFGLGYRFYANDWIALEPRICLEYWEALTYKSAVNISFYFNKPNK